MQASPPDSIAHAPDLDDAKRSFLRMVSHELRTPLNSVIGFSEIISRELHGPIGDPRYKAHAEVIRESGQKLLKLVNQVLEIARLDAGTADLRLEPEAPAAAIKRVTQMLIDEAEARNISFVVDIAPDTPMVLADARGLHTILQNLLQNAVTFSPDGGEVRVTVHPGRNSVLFEIQDQGEGVPAEDIPRLMRPFEQGENALVRRSQGAGLGLSIVTLLCRDMGGRLMLKSAPGEGLTARVRLLSVQSFDGLPPEGAENA
ncbi:MAG: HAMP domain-containing sensor histidine kinase [Caulobacteraceae bacterium]